MYAEEKLKADAAPPLLRLVERTVKQSVLVADQLERLESRLHPVLGPGRTDDQRGDVPQAAPESPLIGELEQAWHQLVRMEARLTELMARLVV